MTLGAPLTSQLFTSHDVSRLNVLNHFRDEAQAKMILLKEKSDKDLQSHNAEMKELLRIIAHERKLREFMKIKDRELQEDQQLVEWRKKKGEIRYCCE